MDSVLVYKKMQIVVAFLLMESQNQLGWKRPLRLWDLWDVTGYIQFLTKKRGLHWIKFQAVNTHTYTHTHKFPYAL